MSTTPSSGVAPANAATPAGLKWLAGTRVVALGATPSMQVAARVLAQFGADVTERRKLRPDGVGLDADIVLVDRIAGPEGLPAPARSAAGYLDYVRRANDGVWVTASAYGLQTSRADLLGSDAVALAAGGVLGHSVAGSGVPILPAGQIALSLVGVFMATAALHGVHELRASGTPVHADLSAQASVISSGMCLEMAHALARCPDAGGTSRYGAPTGFFGCRDGSVYIVVLEQHQWEAFRSSLAPLLDDIGTIEEARTNADLVNTIVAKWTSKRERLECERILQAAGVPCTSVNTMEEFRTRAHHAGRLDETVDDLDPVPGLVRASTGASSGPRGGKPLDQLMVLDAGHVLAVPLATAWLGAMGAMVTKLEDPERLDVYRRRGPFAAGVHGLNRSAYFNQVNYSKTGMDVSVSEGGSTLDASAFDVIVHNLTPRRARAVGVDADTVLNMQAGQLCVTSSGFGASGEWSGYRAYGHNIHAFAGLVAASQDSMGNMADVGTPWADPLSAASIATWILAWSLTDGERRTVSADLSMAELMASQLSSLEGAHPNDYYINGPKRWDFFVQAPADQVLVAVTLTAGQHAAWLQRFGADCRPPDRRASLLTAPLEVLTDQNGEGVANALQREGFAAAHVTNAEQLADDSFVHGTGLFQTVHSVDLGDYEVTGLPWVFVGAGRPTATAPPERSLV